MNHFGILLYISFIGQEVKQEKMEINVNVSKLVKPSTPTPSTLRNFHISFFDDKSGNENVPLILYYSTSHKEPNDVQTNIFNHLEISLSKTLTEFYPLAGRYTRHSSFIDCNDQGALYIQAKANFQLSEFLHLKWELKSDMLQDFLPCDIRKAGEVDDPLLSVKVTTFDCGGVAIGMCISHKFGDMAAFCTFINNWATRSRKTGNELEVAKYSPLFALADRFPKPDQQLSDEAFERSPSVNNSVMRVFSFKGYAITKLREKVMSEDNNIKHRPSKVQLIVALLWKAFVDIDKANGQSKVSFVSQVVNLRNVLVPRAPENFCGNFVTFANAQIKVSEEDNMVDLPLIVKLLHDSTSKTTSGYARALSHPEKDYDFLSKPFSERLKSITGNSDVNAYVFTSWCKFSFYTTDFGWGKPVWRSITDMKTPQTVVMMDDEEGDGVEAWVLMDKKRMCELERDLNIKAYMV
ncbi:putative transferase [Helianthus annuus]|nr:putative transferase [Helianthus annuus]